MHRRPSVINELLIISPKLLDVLYHNFIDIILGNPMSKVQFSNPCRVLFTRETKTNMEILRMLKNLLSYDVASESEITPCNKIDKPLVV